MKIPFKKSNILIPKNVDMSKWSVIACDQYTSEPDYWEDVANIVGDSPSTLQITLPEIYLENENVEKKIDNINNTMNQFLQKDLFNTYENSVIYIERTQGNGSIRQGIIGMVDLEDYSYDKDSQSLIRATEGTVLERIPPRVRVRQNASLELPHIMLLIDDDDKNIIEALPHQVSDFDKIYDFDLMKNGGHITGYKLRDDIIDSLFYKLEALADKDNFEKKYNVTDKGVLLFSVGDGNHSLATAKACYENLKKTLPEEEYINHPARYALVEVVNIHNDALKFEPIHRVVFSVNPIHMIDELKKYYNTSDTSCDGQKISYVYKGMEGKLYITNPTSNLAVGTLQNFIDDYISRFGGKVDYIHGDNVVRKLANEDNNIGFILPNMAKSDLFETVILDGASPRKTFSMGHSYDKRYYLECRKIK